MNQDIYTVYKDVRVFWDEDHDERILARLDAVIPLVARLFGYNPILAAEEHEGTLDVLINMLPMNCIKQDGMELVGQALEYENNRRRQSAMRTIKDLFEYLTVDGDFWPTTIECISSFGYRTHESPFDWFEQYTKIVGSDYGDVIRWLIRYEEHQKLAKIQNKLNERIVELQNKLSYPN